MNKISRMPSYLLAAIAAARALKLDELTDGEIAAELGIDEQLVARVREEVHRAALPLAVSLEERHRAKRAAMTSKPRTVEVLAQVPRTERSRMAVSLDEAASGSRFVSIRREMSGKQGTWIVPRSVSLKPSELREVAAALLRAIEMLKDNR